MLKHMFGLIIIVEKGEGGSKRKGHREMCQQGSHLQEEKSILVLV